MKSNKQVILEDLNENFKGEIDYDKTLRMCYMDQGETVEMRNIRKSIETVSVVTTLLCVAFMIFTIGFIIFSIFADDLRYEVGRDAYDFMYSYCDQVFEQDVYRLSLDLETSVEIYTGVDYLDDGTYVRYYFYNIVNSNPDNNILICTDEGNIEVSDKSYGILTILDEADNLDFSFEIIYKNHIKYYSLELFR